jgi:hypothetical protein
MLARNSLLARSAACVLFRALISASSDCFRWVLLQLLPIGAPQHCQRRVVALDNAVLVQNHVTVGRMFEQPAEFFLRCDTFGNVGEDPDLVFIIAVARKLDKSPRAVFADDGR